MKERRNLQILVAIGSCVPVATGLWGAVHGAALTGDVLTPSGDSHFRYLSGLLLAIGLAFWSTIPRIEASAPRFRLLTVIVATGGLCRILALRNGSWPDAPMLLGAVMELIVTPALCLWQGRVAADRHDDLSEDRA